LEMFSTPVLIQVLHDAFSLGFFFFLFTSILL
jgi:hypothetical protein